MSAVRCVLMTVLCAVSAAALGCAGITVRRANAPDLLDAVRASAVAEGELSPRTLQTLRHWDLEEIYRRQPSESFARLQMLVARGPQPDLIFALAEISYLLGREAEKRESAQACAFYYLSAGYAYHYLFDVPTGPGGDGETEKQGEGEKQETAPVVVSPFDPRFRLACDLYNRGLAKCIRAAQRIGPLDPRQQLAVPAPDDQVFTLSVVRHGFAWKPEEFGSLLLCEDYQVVGLDSVHHRYGLGIPLIGTRVSAAPPSGHVLYPRDLNFPVTAFFRFEGPVADLCTQRAGQLELYNPLAVQTVTVRQHDIPLETDLTTPLAYFLSRTDLGDLEYSGFLRGEKFRNRAGIYMFEPYQPGKIPVLMIHGLTSSPITWIPMFNDLRADPVLRERFQFWFYFYPTGSPYVVTAADLRRSLAELHTELDPGHSDRALDNMVLLGHSMGGLVGRLLTVDSGDDFWQLVSSKPFDSLKAAPQTRTVLRPIFFFERQECIRRVVFLGTPHHGSKLARAPLVRLARDLVKLPESLTTAAHDLVRENPDLGLKVNYRNLPTSLDLLAPGSPALELLASRPLAPGVHYHSIVGKAPLMDVLLTDALTGHLHGEETDGVVTRSSAHLDGVDSEVLVPADHDHVHSQPLAILEVRRILLQHLKDSAP